MTVNEYLKFIKDLKNSSDQDLKQVIQDCQLESVLLQLCKKLSKGFQQRVGLAQALLGSPALVILDEPTSGFDPEQIDNCLQLIKKRRAKQTFLISSHSLAEVESVCNKVLVMKAGEVVLQTDISAINQVSNLEQSYFSSVK